MIKPPTGKRMMTLHTKQTSLIDIRKNIKKKCVLIKIQDRFNAWVIFNGDYIVASYFEDTENLLVGKQAISEIDRKLKEENPINVYELDSKLMDMFCKIYPDVKVMEKVESAVISERMRDNAEVVSKEVADNSQFTEEWESGLIEKKESVPQNLENVPPKLEIAYQDVLDKKALSEEPKKEEKKAIEEEIVAEDNYFEFIRSLKNFTGIVTGQDGSIELTAFLKDGEIVAAIVKDEDIEIKGLSAILYFDTSARIRAVRKSPEDLRYPEDAKCEEDEDAKSSFYKSI